MMNQSYLARSAIIRYRMSIPIDPPPIPTPLPEPPLEPPYNPYPHPINDPPPHLF
ncbi:hypothetical protein JZM24_15810 [Candidatus Sodalis endolongispinus]|uniref:Uncharacterized protein n=1 Tax=Candidatus Sodalis endolongispinus TaxID=2812662 RepID=A0ABS5YDY3_9GAMM|nr:hypothetical protein [Candidatus Sodalis endolongispinus]MBT9433216.1 hypothetical protein [Candidatus Sodalis endolongispinus]